MNGDDITYGPPVTFSVDGEPMTARPGQTIAAALYANGTRVLRRTRRDGKPRGLYCAMGVCFDCVVEVDGETARACMRYVAEGMRVTLRARFQSPADAP